MKTKNLLAIVVVALFAISCSNKGQNENKDKPTQVEASAAIDASITNVYYFHGKQRCKTCIAVGNLAKKTIEEAFAENEKVQFIEVDTSNKEFADLVEKFEVSWNALIIARGDKSIDLTEQAFATAVNSPEILEEKIKEEVNKIAG